MGRTTIASCYAGNGVTISGSNLIATGNTGVEHGAESVHPKTAGKWYFEAAANALSSGDSGVGFRTVGRSVNSFGASGIFGIAAFKNGGIFNNGTSQANLGGIGSTTIGCAIDLDAKLAWFRKSPSGNWNADALANPATGVGGKDISAWCASGLGVAPYANVAANGDAFTFNFGGSAYSGTAPSGFSDWSDVADPALWIDIDSFSQFSSSAGNGSGANASDNHFIMNGTAGANRVIVVFIHTTDPTSESNVASITDTAGLTWTKHTKQSDVENSKTTCEIWWALASSQIGFNTLTITWNHTTSGGFGYTAQSWAFVNANTTAPFDTNAGIPFHNTGTSSTPSVTGVNTTNANDILIAFQGNDVGTTPTAPSGFVDAGSQNNTHATQWSVQDVGFKIVTATQSSLTETGGTSVSKWTMTATAIRQASQAPSGTWASTEAADTFQGSSAPSGSWASTETPDTFAGAGYPELRGTLGATEAKDVFAGTGVPGKAFGIDGFTSGGTASNGTSLALTLTTTVAHDVIVVCVSTKGGPVTSITDVAGLTWTKRTGFNPASTPTEDMEIWWAHSPAILSADVITINTTSSSGVSGVAFGVNGANTANPFDTHNANSVTTDNAGSGNPSRTITTDNSTSHTLIFGVLGSDDGGGGVGSGGGNVNAGMDTFLARGATSGGQTEATLVGYKIVTTPQTALSLSFTQNGGTFNDRFLMADAIVEYVPVTGTMFTSDVKDTFAGSGYPQMIGSWASAEAKDVWAGTGTVPPFGPFTPTEAKDTMGFTGEVGKPLSVDTSAAAVAHDTDHCSVAITTTAADDVIVLGILCGGFFSHSSVGTITDTAGLTWKRRHTRKQFGTNPTQEIWWAKKHTVGPTTITVQLLDNSGFICVDALAIAGARADAPFDTHSGAGIYIDNLGTGNPTGVIYSNSVKSMGIAFFGSDDVTTTHTLNAGWTYLDTLLSGENSGKTGRLESAYQIFEAQQLGTTTVTFGQIGGGSNNRCIMHDVIVANNDVQPNAATADVVRWFFDGHGNQMVLQMSGSNRSASKEFTTFNADTTALVAVMVQSSRGARVATITDTGNHSGWAQRSIVTNDVGTTSLELWWVQMTDAFSGSITVTLDDNTQPGDILGFIVLGINGPDLFTRGEIFDGHSSLPAVNHADSISDAHIGPFSTLNENVLEIAITANTSQDPTGSQAQGWLQFVGNFFGSVSGLLVSHAPLFNIALQAKFSGPVVSNDSTTNNQSPSPTDWLMLADAMPVGPVSPPQGIWGSTEFKDITTHNGDFTAIGIANGPGWVGFPPNSAVMAATEAKDRNTNTGAFTAIWAADEGWIGYIPAFYDWHSTEALDTYHNHGWVLGPTTILARWESVEPKDSLGFSSLFTWYTTPDSAGDRTSRITVTTNASLGGSSGVPETLVNGLRANNAASAIWVNNAQAAPMYFRFDFLTPKVVNEALWFQNGPSAQPGLWVWQGSNDASSWTTLSPTPFVFNGGNSGSPVLGDFSTNGTAYRYYQVIQTTNAGGNDTPWLWEAEFKVAGFSGTLGATEAKDRMNYQVQLIPTATPIPARKRRLLIVT